MCKYRKQLSADNIDLKVIIVHVNDVFTSCFCCLLVARRLWGRKLIIIPVVLIDTSIYNVFLLLPEWAQSQYLWFVQWRPLETRKQAFHWWDNESVGLMGNLSADKSIAVWTWAAAWACVCLCSCDRYESTVLLWFCFCFYQITLLYHVKWVKLG